MSQSILSRHAVSDMRSSALDNETELKPQLQSSKDSNIQPLGRTSALGLQNAEAPLSNTASYVHLNATAMNQKALHRKLARPIPYPRKYRSLSPRQNEHASAGPSKLSGNSASQSSHMHTAFATGALSSVPLPHHMQALSHQRRGQGMPQESYPRSSKHLIRVDLGYNGKLDTVYATFELPGVRLEDVTLTIVATSASADKKMLAVSAVSRPPRFGDVIHSSRERIYGHFTRNLIIPSHTQPKDIEAKLEDGLLFLTIRGSRKETVPVMVNKVAGPVRVNNSVGVIAVH